MTTRRELLIWLGGVTAVAGCSEDENPPESEVPTSDRSTTTTGTPGKTSATATSSIVNDTTTQNQATPRDTTEPGQNTTNQTNQQTTEQTPEQTPENTTEQTPENTPEETPQDTPEQTPGNTTETTEPQETATRDELTLEEIYDQYMVNGNKKGKRIVNQNWSTIHGGLEGNYDELPELVEDLATQIDKQTGRPEPVASGMAHALKNKLGYTIDQIMVDARTIMTGAPQDTVTIYTTPNPNQNNPKTQVTTVFPLNKNSHEGRTLKPGEQPNITSEHAITDAFSSDKPDGRSSIFDLDGFKMLIKNSFNDKIGGEGGWNLIDNLSDDLILGYQINGSDGKISYDSAARQRIDEIIDIHNINDKPAEYGTEARKLVENASVFFYNHVEGEDAYMEVSYDDEEFAFSSVDHETHEENIRENFSEYSDN